MTKLHILNVFLTERLMLAAQEIYKAVEDTILELKIEYQEEIIRGKKENDQLRLKLREAGIETWTERQSYEYEEEGECSDGQKVEPGAILLNMEKESTARKGVRPLRDRQTHLITSPPQGNTDYLNTLQPTSHPVLVNSPEESVVGDRLASSSFKQVKTETDVLSSAATSDDPVTLSSLNLHCASAQSENSVSMMGLEGDVGILSEFEVLQAPQAEHSNLQIQDPALRCTVCGKFCRHMGHLNAHARTHTKDKPFLCGLCGKSFSSSGRLKGHQRIHTGEKPYQCHFCRKRFNQTAHLKVHLRVHTGEKPFSCPVCGKSFSQSNKVKRHLITHSRDRPYLPGQ